MFGKFVFTMMLMAVLVYASTPEINEWVDKQFEGFYETEVVYEMPDGNVYEDEIYLNGKTVKIGAGYTDIINTFGDVGRVDLSEYGFLWYVYHNDYKNYIQIGTDGDRVLGVYTNAKSLFFRGIRFGDSKADVMNKLGEPVSYIQKGNVRYHIQANDQKTVYLLDDFAYLTVFFDIHKDNTVTAIQVIEKETEHALAGYFGNPSEELRDSFERQTLDLVNAVRVREGLSALEWDSRAAKSARGHSEDMFERAYFSHETPEGKTPFDRMQKEGIRFSVAGENIAYGMASAIYAHELWMNSEGHRVNILNPDFARLGVGGVVTSSDGIYLTQNFYTPPKFIMG